MGHREILDAQPMRFLKYVEQARALTSGDPDFELPVGNDYVGVLIFHPVSADAGFGTGTIGRLRPLRVHVEVGIAAAPLAAVRAWAARFFASLRSRVAGFLLAWASPRITRCQSSFVSHSWRVSIE